MFNMDDLNKKPREKVLSIVTHEAGEPEMSEFESSFLCGIIKKSMPKKILELGVAGGGTTAIILETLRELGLENETEVVSVDLNELFYRGDGRQTGFLAREYKDKVGVSFNHRFELGSYLPEVIEEIGGDIDLAIVDTVHLMPGEILDYLVLLKFLSDDAYVVLHDISYHLYQFKDGVGFSNTVLFNVALGEKIIILNGAETRKFVFPNIGAWKLCNKSKEDVIPIMHALSLPWEYMPSDEEIDKYLLFYQKYYDEIMVKGFCDIIKCQKSFAEGKKH